jgi:hypothetical protein
MKFEDAGLAPGIEQEYLRASRRVSTWRGAVKDRRRGLCGSDDGQGSSIGMDSPSLPAQTA